MKLLSLIFKNNVGKMLVLTLLSIIAGSMHVLFLVLINNTLSGLINNIRMRYIDIFYALGTLIIFLITNRWLMGKTINFSLKIVHEIRLKLMSSALQKSYSEMTLKQDILFSAISKDTVTLSYAALSVTQLLMQGITIIGCIIYLSFLSWQMLIFIIFITSLGVFIYLIGAPKNMKHMQNARENEDSIFYNAKQVISGFKEIKIDPQKGTDIVNGPLLKSSINSTKFYSKGYSGFYNSSLIGQFLIYLALVCLLFGGIYFNTVPTLLMNCIIVILYLIGPLEGVTALIPQLGEGNIAAIRLMELLDTSQSEVEVRECISHHKDFEKIRYESLLYTYPSCSYEESFTVGPINLTINKGEVLFIYGGNGSGKTTMLYLLINILKPQHGTVFIDDKLVDTMDVYSNLFAAVFSDFCLFDAFYGNKNVDLEKADYYLKLFELDQKVTVTKNGFSNINLSTGQRKRLALIASILENKHILILDEWAADQSPDFRRKFYNEIIPLLKLRGFTIIAITHDDQYYSAADTLYCMNYGQLKKI